MPNRNCGSPCASTGRGCRLAMRRWLRLALEARGYVVREAENGRLGLQEAVFHRPDVILLDLE